MVAVVKELQAKLDEKEKANAPLVDTATHTVEQADNSLDEKEKILKKAQRISELPLIILL